MNIQQLVHSFLSLFKRKQLKIGLYGLPNSGKTTLANRVCADWLGETMGSISAIAHETRTVQLKESVTIKNKTGGSLKFSLVDTPGLAAKIDYKEFVRAGLAEEVAKQRAREATRGVLEAITWLSSMDVILVVVDATKNPESQVNRLLIDNLVLRGTPVLLVANKIDLHTSNVSRIQSAFKNYPVVGVSGKLGTNMEQLYESVYALAK